jgi:hypothetical protein
MLPLATYTIPTTAFTAAYDAAYRVPRVQRSPKVQNSLEREADKVWRQSLESVALKEEITKLLGSVNKYEEELIKHERKLITFQEFQEQFSICAWESKVLVESACHRPKNIV